MCSETEPRLSFSRDIPDEPHPPPEEQCRRDADLLRLSCAASPTADHPFEFSVSIGGGNDQYPSSSADELFAGGILLPFHLLNRHNSTSSAASDAAPIRRRAQSFDNFKHFTLPPPPLPSGEKQSPPQSAAIATIPANPPPIAAEEQPTKPQSRSIWGFKRSSSLNCDLKKTLISSLPPLLSRSKSTGSVQTPKKAPPSAQKTEIPRQHKQHHYYSPRSSSSSAAAANYAYSFPQKPPLKKKNSYGGGGGGGMGSSSLSGSHNQYLNGTARISPVLNVPAISKGTANLFGLGSILIGKEKKSRK